MPRAKITKKVKKGVPKVKKITKVAKKIIKYFEGLGRRKTAIAQIRLFNRQGKEKTFLVNEKPLERYFSTIELQKIALSPLELMNCLEQFNLSIKVRGGGLVAQAEAVRHGIAKTLVLFNPDFKKTLKKAGFLTRDPRMRERKKFGLKRARRAPQWQKR